MSLESQNSLKLCVIFQKRGLWCVVVMMWLPGEEAIICIIPSGTTYFCLQFQPSILEGQKTQELNSLAASVSGSIWDTGLD